MMKDLDIFYQPPAEIREHKDVSYTIRVIGGPEQYKQYCEDKALRLEQ
jgi:hypothetical protein